MKTHPTTRDKVRVKAMKTPDYKRGFEAFGHGEGPTNAAYSKDFIRDWKDAEAKTPTPQPAAHTAIPWNTYWISNQLFIAAISNPHTEIAELRMDNKQVEANAAYIVRACNSHDELVKILEHLLENPLRLSPIPEWATKQIECALTRATQG